MWDIPLNVEDRDKPVADRPQLPPEYAKLLRDEPLVAEVLAVGTPQRRLSTEGVDAVKVELTLGAGSAQGVYQGTEFFFRGPLTRGRITVTSVDEDRCKAELMTFPGQGAAATLPAVGNTVSTASR
jgi:hypothetical protein